MAAVIEERLSASAAARGGGAVDEGGRSLAPIIASATALLQVRGETELQVLSRCTAIHPLAPLLQRGCGAVVVTLGAAGALVVLGHATPDAVCVKLVPGSRLRPEEVVDTTGAGDAFAGEEGPPPTQVCESPGGWRRMGCAHVVSRL